MHRSAIRSSRSWQWTEGEVKANSIHRLSLVKAYFKHISRGKDWTQKAISCSCTRHRGYRKQGNLQAAGLLGSSRPSLRPSLYYAFAFAARLLGSTFLWGNLYYISWFFLLSFCLSLKWIHCGTRVVALQAISNMCVWDPAILLFVMIKLEPKKGDAAVFVSIEAGCPNYACFFIPCCPLAFIDSVSLPEMRVVIEVGSFWEVASTDH